MFKIKSLFSIASKKDKGNEKESEKVIEKGKGMINSERIDSRPPTPRAFPSSTHYNNGEVNYLFEDINENENRNKKINKSEKLQTQTPTPIKMQIKNQGIHKKEPEPESMLDRSVKITFPKNGENNGGITMTEMLLREKVKNMGNIVNVS